MALAFEIAVVLLLIVLNGVFAMSEMAVVSSRKARLRSLADSGSAGARAVLRVVDQPGRFLSTVQIGITLIGIVAGAFGGTTIAARLGAWLDGIPALRGHGEEIAFAAVVVAITYLSLVVGELVPKRIALSDPERFAAGLARPMRLLSRIAAPAVWLLGASTDAALRLLGLSGTREATVTEDEVRSLITEGTRAGIFDPREQEMIDGVLRLADRSVRAIMTPRPDVVWLDATDPAEVVAREIRSARHSRFPVCRGDLDDVVGIVHAKDLIDRLLDGRPLDLPATATEALVVHDGMRVLKLLDLFRDSGEQMAVVVDEYGSVEGVVTLTDIVETIAGELPGPGEVAEAGAVRREDGSWLVDGAMPIDEAEARLGMRGLHDEDAGYTTLAGFVLDRLGHLPTAGEAVEFAGARFEVIDMDGRRIDKVLVVPPKPAEEPGEDFE